MFYNEWGILNLDFYPLRGLRSQGFNTYIVSKHFTTELYILILDSGDQVNAAPAKAIFVTKSTYLKFSFMLTFHSHKNVSLSHQYKMILLDMLLM